MIGYDTEHRTHRYTYVKGKMINHRYLYECDILHYCIVSRLVNLPKICFYGVGEMGKQQDIIIDLLTYSNIDDRVFTKIVVHKVRRSLTIAFEYMHPMGCY